MRSLLNTKTTHLKCFIESKCHQNYISIRYFSTPSTPPPPPPPPHVFSRKWPKTPNLTHFTMFFGLCDLEICHMTLKIWEPQAVSVSNHMIKYQGNRWWNVFAKAGTDGQTNGRTDKSVYGYVCRSLKWHTLHTITPNKWPKHKRKRLT